jgi:superfamily II DNA or RNA helicase
MALARRVAAARSKAHAPKRSPGVTGNNPIVCQKQAAKGTGKYFRFDSPPCSAENNGTVNLDLIDRIEDALDTLCSEKAYDDGSDDHSEGRAVTQSIVTRPDGSLYIEGSVVAARGKVFSVRVIIPAENLEDFAAACSCGSKTMCRHIAAVLLQASDPIEDDDLMVELSDADPESGELPTPARDRAIVPLPSPAEAAPSPSARRAAPRLRRDVKVWLRQLDLIENPAVTRPQDAQYPAGMPWRLLYLLKPTGTCLEIELLLGEPNPRGGYTRTKKTNLHHLLSDSNSSTPLRPLDLILLRNLMKAGRVSYSEISLEGKAGAQLMPAILSTGYCHLGSHDKKHPVLRLGSPRPATPVWQVGDNGWQAPTLRLDSPPTAVLPLAPPWYVDETEGTCGPLATGLRDEVAATWLEAPALSPEEAALLADRFSQPSAATASVPAPSVIPIEDLPPAPPVPCLKLFVCQARSYYTSYYRRRGANRNGLEASLADVSFDYAGWGRVERSNNPGTMEVFRDGKLHRLQRDPNAEARCEARLFDFGFVRADTQLYDLPADHRRALTLTDEADWSRFVHETLPELRQAGWRIEIDREFAFACVEAESWYADAGQLGGDSDWFGIELGVMLEGQKLNLLPILLEFFRANPDELSPEKLAALPPGRGVAVPLPDGRNLIFPGDRLRAMLGVLLDLLDADALNKRGRLKVRRLRAAELSGLADDDAHWRWLGGAELRALNERLRNFNGIQTVAPPAGLLGTLRPYQQEGLNWLQFLREYELAGILADDMGLGKTVQALAHLLIEKEAGRADRPSLVIAPTSLMTNWRQEAERFAPSLRTLVLHGLDRKQHFEQVAGHDLVFTTYALLPRDQDFLLQQQFHCVILDEAQYIKNPKTACAQIACRLAARHRLCLTGTPMENHLGELWSIFSFLLPGFLGEETRFSTLFRRPIEKGRSDDRRKLLARRVGPFILRRRKEEVVKELPPKTEIVQNVELGEAQRDLYESIRLSMHSRVKEEVDKKGINRAQIIILDALLKLRQVCCDPRLLHLPSAAHVTESAKLELLMDLLPSMIDEGRRILLFSQFTSMLALVEAALGQRQIPYVLLTGETRDRATPIRRFQDREVPLFLISLKAGGTGLNLTAADTVIHYDPWWNPAVENQATDRAHRIGQDKAVFVYKLMTVGTVEEKIAALQARKRALVEGLLNEEQRSQVSLTAQDLEVLFGPIA